MCYPDWDGAWVTYELTAAGFFSVSVCPKPYAQRHITLNKNVYSPPLIKTFPFILSRHPIRQYKQFYFRLTRPGEEVAGAVRAAPPEDGRGDRGSQRLGQDDAVAHPAGGPGPAEEGGQAVCDEPQGHAAHAAPRPHRHGHTRVDRRRPHLQRSPGRQGATRCKLVFTLSSFHCRGEIFNLNFLQFIAFGVFRKILKSTI